MLGLGNPIGQVVHRFLRVPYNLHTKVIRSGRTSRQTIVFIHGIGNSGDVWKPVIDKLPADRRVITVDLLGFGKSPSPVYATYDTKTQARSVARTLLKLGLLPGRPVVVGHSLGALVAVELARRYPLFVKRLVLCSPPFYSDQTSRKLLASGDNVLRKIYRLIQNHPDEFVKISNLALRYKLVSSALNLSSNNVTTYMAALESSIVNQTALSDAKSLSQPMTVIHGRLDPVVIGANLKQLKAANEKVKLIAIPTAGHEVRGGAYIGAVVDSI